jgi:hypothetical protein
MTGRLICTSPVSVDGLRTLQGLRTFEFVELVCSRGLSRFTNHFSSHARYSVVCTACDRPSNRDAELLWKKTYALLDLCIPEQKREVVPDVLKQLDEDTWEEFGSA